MFCDFELKKINVFLAKYSILLSFFVLNFILPIFSIIMLNTHQVIFTNENHKEKIVFHHEESNFDTFNHSNHQKYLIDFSFSENKKSHHDHFFQINTFPDITSNGKISNTFTHKYSNFFYLDNIKVFDYSFQSKNQLFAKVVNFSPQKEDTISKSLKTIVLTI